MQYRLGQIHKQKLDALASPPAGHTAAAFTMLVVGSDSRAALSGPDNSQFGGSAAVGGQRSDTMILLRVAPARHQLMMMSIPRDLWVNIPRQGANRINSAFDNGPNLLIQTIEQDLGIPINHYAEVNFDTFRDITNAVRSVKLYFPTPAKDTYSDLNIPAPGCYTLTGDQALAFVRSRHYQYEVNGRWVSESESDLARIQRQQSFIKKMVKKAEGEFTNPVALNGVIGGVTKNLTVDTGFSSGLMIKLAEELPLRRRRRHPLDDPAELPVHHRGGRRGARPGTAAGGADHRRVQPVRRHAAARSRSGRQARRPQADGSARDGGAVEGQRRDRQRNGYGRAGR